MTYIIYGVILNLTLFLFYFYVTINISKAFFNLSYKNWRFFMKIKKKISILLALGIISSPILSGVNFSKSFAQEDTSTGWIPVLASNILAIYFTK